MNYVINAKIQLKKLIIWKNISLKRFLYEKQIKKKNIMKFKQKVWNLMKFINPKTFNRLSIKEILKENLLDI